jgi:hypothetical protein
MGEVREPVAGDIDAEFERSVAVTLSGHFDYCTGNGHGCADALFGEFLLDGQADSIGRVYRKVLAVRYPMRHSVS